MVCVVCSDECMGVGVCEVLNLNTKQRPRGVADLQVGERPSN